MVLTNYCEGFSNLFIENTIHKNLNITEVLFIFGLIAIFVEDYASMHWTAKARKVNTLSGGLILPFVGNAWIFFGAPHKVCDNITKYFQKHGKCCRFWKLNSPRYFIADADICEKVLTSANIDKGEDYATLRTFFGNGLVTVGGDQWRMARKEFNPSFNFQRFDGFLKVFNKGSDKLCEKISEIYENYPDFQGVYSLLKRASTDMVFETILDNEMAIQDEGEEQLGFSKSMDILADGLHKRIFKPWLTHPLFSFLFFNKREEEAKNYILTKIKEAKNAIEKRLDDFQKSKTKSFVEVVLQIQPQLFLSDKDCDDHINTIAAAGTETTASSVLYTLFYLANYPEYQKKCQEEVDQLIGDGNEVSLSMLSQVKFLEMCWKEALRLKPPVPMITRKLKEDLDLGNGQTLTKGADAVVSLFHLHRDPKSFPNPDVFNPYNFKLEAISSRSAYSFIPFSIGIRNCIGMRYATMAAKTTLIKILLKFNIHSCQKPEDIKAVFGVNVTPFPEIKLLFEHRNK